jgi:RHS repeat-associated protein
VRAVTTTGNSVQEAHDYYPFGLIMPGRSTTGSPPTRERFTGQERDFETGLDYFGARFYFPAIGRWMSVDPLDDTYPAWSPYNYVMNNPLRFIDPDGKSPDFYRNMRGEITWIENESRDRFFDEEDVLWTNIGTEVEIIGGTLVQIDIPTIGPPGSSPSQAVAFVEHESLEPGSGRLEEAGLGHPIELIASGLLGIARSAISKPASLQAAYATLVSTARRRFGGNVTVQRDGRDLFRIHQPSSGHGYSVTQIVRRPRRSDGRVFETPRQVSVW